MKQLLLILILFLGTCSLHQAQSNRFSESEESGDQYTGTSSRNMSHTNDATLEDDDPGDPPNPGDPVPIDDYIPLLLLTGAGLIIGLHYRKRLQTK